MKFAAVIAMLVIVAAGEQARFPRTMYVSFDHAPIYDSSSHLSTVVATMRLGDTLSVLGVERKFFRVAVGTRDGYILGTNVSLRRPVKRVEPTEKPSRSARASAPVAEEERCKGTTKSGSRCSRRADSTGFCWQHMKRSSR